MEKFKRFTVVETDYKWDKCWGVFDALEKKFITKDSIKKHCIDKANELNKNPPKYNVNPSGTAPITWFIN